jgi:hypothetical protein
MVKQRGRSRSGLSAVEESGLEINHIIGATGDHVCVPPEQFFLHVSNSLPLM